METLEQFKFMKKLKRLKRDEDIISTGAPLSVKLGPGMIRGIFDGIERPLEVIKEKHGSFMPEAYWTYFP